MKLFLSADIEGTTAITSWLEAEGNAPEYYYFSKLMTNEVNAVCKGADLLGFDVLVRDAHNTARNINPSELFPKASLLRGWTGDIYCMMSGIDSDKFDVAAFTGYHSMAMSGGNSLAHTMTRRAYSVKLNGEYISEFVLNVYTAAMFNVPVVFLSGDEELCKSAKKLVPDIITVATKKGIGDASISQSPQNNYIELEEKIKEALIPEHIQKCHIELPKHFKAEITYVNQNEAYKNSFYPSATLSGARTVVFENNNYLEILRFIHFTL